ncbi:MAG: AMP-binding protein [Anaerolineae bacterium]|nr:AMP-binding protein [Anaerolineae bacterium]
MTTRLQRQIEHAYTHSPATKVRFDAVGVNSADIQTVADLQKLPVLPKDDVIRMQQADPPFGGLLAVSPDEISHIFFSPGPLYEPETEHDSGSLDTIVQVLRQCGFEANDIVLNTLSYHLVPAGLTLDAALTQLGCTVVPGGVGNSDLQLMMMRTLGVTGYVGTPSFLQQLIEKAEASGELFKPAYKVSKALFTAEPLAASWRQRLVEQYGIAVGNGYATAELGFLALNTDGGMAMHLLPEPVIEIVDSDTGQCVGPGEVGEVVVTNFSRAYPLIRLGTGDMAVNIDPNPGASRQEERALMLVGRKGEAVKVRGMFVHPNQLRFAAGQVVPFTAIQGVVTRPEARDEFVVRIVTMHRDKTEVLKAAIAQACRVGVDTIAYVDEIEAGAPGMLDLRDWD